ncbi:MAG: hypothetical protein OIF34_01935, partial [Porticoccaceae bacterium]|nr:hypothetical protein [Porticoccaceae bacterium]
IKFEDKIDDWQLVYAVQSIVRQMGHLVFRPDLLVDNFDARIPWTLTPYEILAAGKQVLIYKSGDESDTFPAAGWMNSWAWGGIPGEASDSGSDEAYCSDLKDNTNYTFTEAAEEDIATDKYYSLDTYKRLARCKNGSMIFGDWWYDSKAGHITDASQTDTADNGDADARIKASIWSWEHNFPKSDGQACAYFYRNSAAASDNREHLGYIKNDTVCDSAQRYACVDSSDRSQWKVTTNTSPWGEGDASCKTEFGNNYLWDMPRDGYEAQQLGNASNANTNKLWVNYTAQNSDNLSGAWLTRNDRVMREGLSDVVRHELKAKAVSQQEILNTYTSYSVDRSDNYVAECGSMDSNGNLHIGACGIRSRAFACV